MENVKPPEDLDGEALLEWHRVLTELPALAEADRATLVLWCKTWQINQQAFCHVNKFGSVLPAVNKSLGRSPWYSVYMETTSTLAKLADQLGLTRKARGYDKKNEDELIGELD